MTTETARGDAARQRGLQAAERAAELGERRKRMKSQRSASPDDVARAQISAQVALERSSEALSRAIAAHHRSSGVHRRVAQMYDDRGEAEKAARHREAAEESERAGREAAEATHPRTELWVDASPVHPDNDVCPLCGSSEPFSVNDRIVLCADCGHVWQAWTEQTCRHHLWVTGSGDGGRPELEQHCAVCGEVRLVPREQL